MRPSKEIEEFVRLGKPEIKTGGQMDKRTLDDSFSAMDRAMQTQSSDSSPGRKKLISLTVLRIAAAAAVIMAIGLFITHSSPDKKIEISRVTNETKSPAEMLTLRSLKIAYQKGGIEAVETQCDEAIEKLGPKSKNLNVQELFTEINDV
jgi:hypothetical protein